MAGASVKQQGGTMSKFQEILDNVNDNPIRVYVTPVGIGFDWSYKGRGFGGIFLSLVDGKQENPENYPVGRLHIESERETKDFVKKVICQAIDESDFK
jgi:hypothetical protein